MPWQIIVTLLALTAIGWWLWRRLDARAAEMGPNAFEATAKEQPTPTSSGATEPAGVAGPPATEAPGPGSAEERG